jgi:hypothetical protein
MSDESRSGWQIWLPTVLCCIALAVLLVFVGCILWEVGRE